MNERTASLSRLRMRFDRVFMIGVALFAVGYLAWSCFDSARHIGLDGPWFQDLFLIFVSLVYGLFALAVGAVVLKELGLVAFRGRKHKGRPS